MGPCIAEIDLNRCRNEEIIVIAILAWPKWAGGAPGLVMGPYIAEIDRIVIREVQYQFEVNQCRNEEIIVKGNFGWAWPMRVWPMLAGCPRIDHIVIREVQYQFEVNRCRNEEIIVICNFGWAWPMWPRRPRFGNGAMYKAQYQFKVNRFRNEEVNDVTIPYPTGRLSWKVNARTNARRTMWTMTQAPLAAGHPAPTYITFDPGVANSVGGAGGQDGQTDAHHNNIPTLSLKNVG
ncbi:hypothetical protein DPMN_090375 [Dreissena polymorpha]|uniref:Uncharacterized protein n=1 Tax=Dreissena polymorpha TaxID=45954 RepID=A0A9D4KZL9_DREPO|nr:hypothetical protein DPMN_090375 [Dreissena polymorpha]